MIAIAVEAIGAQRVDHHEEDVDIVALRELGDLLGAADWREMSGSIGLRAPAQR